MLTKEEQNHYSRHLMLPEIGEAGQLKQKQAKVLVIGAGGLGCPVLQYLTAAGVGTIGIVDNDIVEKSNLQRQILYSYDDLGKAKVQVVKEKLSRLNPYVKINAHHTLLDQSNAESIISKYDIIVDGSDNFATRYLVNDTCVKLNKPLVFGSVHKFQGQVSVFNYKNGPTYRCVFPESPSENEMPACSEIGVLGVLPGIVGCLQANETIKIIVGMGEILSGKLLTIDAFTLQFNTYAFQRSDNGKDFEVKDFCKISEQKSVSFSELQHWMDRKEDIQIIDVREVTEHENYNIGGTLIPLSEIEKSIDKISREKKVVIHCEKGGRSMAAIQLLQSKYSFTNIYNLEGGIEAAKNQRIN